MNSLGCRMGHIINLVLSQYFQLWNYIPISMISIFLLSSSLIPYLLACFFACFCLSSFPLSCHCCLYFSSLILRRVYMFSFVRPCSVASASSALRPPPSPPVSHLVFIFFTIFPFFVLRFLAVFDLFT